MPELYVFSRRAKSSWTMKISGGRLVRDRGPKGKCPSVVHMVMESLAKRVDYGIPLVSK